MRQALNENPVVQVVLLGILGIVVAFMFMTRVMGGNETSEPAAESTATATPAAGTAPTTTPAPAESVPTTPVTPGAEPDAAAPAGPGFEPGAGLPASVVSAYEAGDVVALLVVNSRAAEDNRLKSEVAALRSRGDTSLFVAEAKDVARYSRIAEGVNLDRVPALVVIQPKRLVEGELPAATISYGFRGSESVRQAVNDALYEGKALPYHPG